MCCWVDWLFPGSAKSGCRPEGWFQDWCFQGCWFLVWLCPESSLESGCSEWSPGSDSLALFPELELSVKSRGSWIQGWLFLASDSQCLAWEQRFREPEGLCPELSWSIPACWCRARLIPVWWSDPV